MNKVEIIQKLTDSNEKEAYEFAKNIIAESAKTDKYVDMIPDFVNMLQNKSSYTRTRAFILICNQAKWANNQIEKVFDQMKPLLNDPKPTVVRQCLKALHEVALYKPNMCNTIKDAISKINLGNYKDSMSPLIKKDIDELMKTISNNQ